MEKDKETKEEVEEEPSEKPKEEVVKKIPEGFYVTEVPESFANIIALGKKQVLEQELLVKMANALVKAGLMEE